MWVLHVYMYIFLYLNDVNAYLCVLVSVYILCIVISFISCRILIETTMSLYDDIDEGVRKDSKPDVCKFKW